MSLGEDPRPITIGEYIETRVLEAYRISRKTLARTIGISDTGLREIIKETGAGRMRSRISPLMAMKLERLTGAAALGILMIQAQHELWEIRNNPRLMEKIDVVPVLPRPRKLRRDTQ